MSTDVLIRTAEDLFEMPNDGNRYELVQGVLRKMSPAGGAHGEVECFLGAHLMFHARKNRLGSTYVGDTGFKIRTNPDTVLAPDVAFVTRERVQTIPDRFKFIPLVPDLVIEILSPGDREREVLLKVADWLSAGTRAVILVHPRKKTVRLFRSAEQFVALSEQDVLEVPDIVPGWSVSIAEIFETL
ncbi:MAG: putative restriction endonuclease [Planctomycetaceae bacterium]|nr:putative restriction endonuclease [Planctomycetaceae bacterium]